MMLCADDWEPAGGLVLEPNGLQSVKESQRSVALTAGPGAGKTEVLAQRCDFLLRTNYCPHPRKILAISFKVDARLNLEARVEDRCGQLLARRLDSRTFHGFANRIIRRYRVALTGVQTLKSGYSIGDSRIAGSQIHYDDLVPLATTILSSNVYALNALRQTYSHVLLDEFQDCTPDQYALVKLAFLDSSAILTAVGDTKQRIMGFAGALEGIFTTFAQDFNARPLNLYQNHRSANRIRRVHNKMVKVMDAPAAVPDADIAGADGVVDLRAFDTAASEAAGIAELIQRRISDNHVDPADIAVLVSKQSNLYLEDFFAIMDKSSIRVRNEQSQQNLTLEPMFRLIADFFAVTIGHRRPVEYTRLVDTLAGLGDHESDDRARTWWMRYLARSRQRLQADELEHTSVIVDEVGSFLENLAGDFVRSLSFDYSSSSYVQDVVGRAMDNVRSAYSRALTADEAIRFLDDRDAVRVLTVHKSKGLEFDTVVLAAIEEETFFGKVEEDRCAYFVGVSRAKERLIVTYALDRPQPSEARRWKRHRRPHAEFLSYLSETE